jgi:hypothetical protein
MTTNIQTIAGNLNLTGNVTVSSNISASTFGADLINLVYPVGAIYISNVSTNPGTYLTGTTWAAHGAGRTIAGLDSGDSDFNTPGGTGGSKTHTLTEAELPSHTHNRRGFPFEGGYNENGSQWTTFNTGNYRGIPIRRGGVQANYARYSGNAGTSTAYNVMQPYIVNYVWIRTA